MSSSCSVTGYVHTRSGGTPSQGLVKVQSSHIITPKLKISHFSEKGSLRISSGAIHSGVPAETASLIVVPVIILDSPKSHIFTVHLLLNRQFALFISRCTIPIRCMHINPLCNISKTFLLLQMNMKLPHWDKLKIKTTSLA